MQRIPAAPRYIYAVQKVDDNPISHAVVTVNAIAVKPRYAQLRDAIRELRFENCANRCLPIEPTYVGIHLRHLRDPRLSKYFHIFERRRSIDKIRPIRFNLSTLRSFKSHFNRSSSNKLRDREEPGGSAASSDRLDCRLDKSTIAL